MELPRIPTDISVAQFLFSQKPDDLETCLHVPWIIDSISGKIFTRAEVSLCEDADMVPWMTSLAFITEPISGARFAYKVQRTPG